MDRNLGLHILSHSAHIGVHGEPFGSYLGPFPHPSECTGAHSDRTCVPFSTHREAGVPIRIAIASESAPTGVYGSRFLTSPKTWHKQKRMLSRVLTSQKLGRQKSDPRGNMCCLLLRFRRSRGTKKQQTVPRRPPCPGLLGFFAATHAAGARMVPKWAEWSVREADMG